VSNIKERMEYINYSVKESRNLFSGNLLPNSVGATFCFRETAMRIVIAEVCWWNCRTPKLWDTPGLRVSLLDRSEPP
jgi:hypothetical protein